jgi:hypothetical protein
MIEPSAAFRADKRRAEGGAESSGAVFGAKVRMRAIVHQKRAARVLSRALSSLGTEDVKSCQRTIVLDRVAFFRLHESADAPTEIDE